MSVGLRPAGRADLEAITALSARVGWPHRSQDIAAMLAVGRGLVVAPAAGAPAVACGFWWPVGREAATLGLIIVDPDRQGRGLGRRIVEALIADAAPRLLRLVATEAGRPLYERLGFEPRGRILQVQGRCVRPPVLAPGLRPATTADREVITALDSAAQGGARAALIARLQGRSRTLVLPASGPPGGFAIRRRFGRGHLIGPLVAGHEDDALRLCQALLRPGFLRADLPEHATALAALLRDAGLDVVDRPLVMQRGERPGAQRGPRTFALASQALG